MRAESWYHSKALALVTAMLHMTRIELPIKMQEQGGGGTVFDLHQVVCLLSTIN